MKKLEKRLDQEKSIILFKKYTVTALHITNSVSCQQHPVLLYRFYKDLNGIQ